MFKIGSPERHFFINIICGLCYKKRTRRLLRVLLDSPIFEQVKFVKQDSGMKHPKLRFFTGYRGKSLVIGVNDKYVYKFLYKDFDLYNAEREKVITEEFSKISNIKIPRPTLLKYKYGIVKKYEYVKGVSMCQMSDDRIMKIPLFVAEQVAKFLFNISKQNPEILYKYKKNPTDEPRYMYGWCHGDIGDNLMMDKNNNIVAIIDWEGTAFCDFSVIFNKDKRKPMYEFMQQVKNYYDRMYFNRK